MRRWHCMKQLNRRHRPTLESLEKRLAPAVNLLVGPNIDVSQYPGDQSEAAIAIDPVNPQRMVAVSNDFLSFSRGGTANHIYISNDAGLHWTGRLITMADSTGTLGAGDPTVVFDQFGNLFFSFMDNEGSSQAIHLAMSFDGGLTFARTAVIDVQPDPAPGVPGVDHPAVAVGDGMVWVEWTRILAGDTVFAAGARVTGLGAVGPFSPPMEIPSSTDGSFGNISIGPSGQVLVSFQAPLSSGTSSIFVSALGPFGFGAPVMVTPTNLAFPTFIPPQPIRGIDAEGVLTAFDTSGAHAGRVYLVYTAAPSPGSINTNIFVRFSDNSGATWSSPVQVNDDTSGNSHFMPQIAVDQSTGNVAVAWYDARHAGPADDIVQIYAAVSVDGGLSFSANVPISAGSSGAALAEQANLDPNDFGDYYRMTFVNGVIHPIWADNSAGLFGNPDAPSLDIATAAVSVTTGPPSLSGQVYVDSNGNARLDPTEVGLPGVTITLNGITAGGTPVFATVVTDISGRFDFTGLAPGVYNLVETQPVNFVPGPAFPGNLGGVAGFDSILDIPVSDVQGVDYDFTQLGLTSNAISKATLLGSLAGLITLSGPPGTGVTLVDPPLQPNTHYIITGAGYGHAPLISVYNTMNVLELQFYAYDPRFLGGVRVALGDVSGDGVPDIIAAPGPGGGPDVRIFDGRNGDLIGEFMAYDPRFNGGLFIAAGDFNCDGFADIVTAPGGSGGPEVKVFGGRSTIARNPKLYADFMAYDPRFPGGVRVAVGDVNHDGMLDIITGAGPGGGPEVRVFSGLALQTAYPAGDIVRDFNAFDPAYNGGVNVAAADVNSDGFADILVSGATLSAEVRIYSGMNLAIFGIFLAEGAAEPAGLNIAALPTGLGSAGIITGGGTTSMVSVLNPGDHALLDRFFTDATELTGVYVGGF
jgi:hypothetical protein